jgi:hypothetical protein
VPEIVAMAADCRRFVAIEPRFVAQPFGRSTVAFMSEVGFGLVLHGSESKASFRQIVARADDLGCDVLAAPDHLGTPEPFAVLAAAA